MKIKWNYYKEVKNGNFKFIINLNLKKAREKIKNLNHQLIRKDNYFHITIDDFLLILELKSQNYSNRKVAKILRVDHKTISNNLKKLLIFKSCPEKKKKKHYRIVEYSFDKWLNNYLSYNKKRRIIGEKISLNKFNVFIKWLSNLEKRRASYSAIYLIYIFKKRYPNHPVPSTQTIYFWSYKRFYLLKGYTSLN